jgi:AraC-like DNA-binding protein
VFVRRGAYRLHYGRDEMLIDPLSLLFFRKGDGYAVSHPFGCGDDCVEFGFSDAFAAELYEDDGCRGFAAQTMACPADAGMLWAQSVLATRAARGEATDLEVEELAISILRSARQDGQLDQQVIDAGSRKKIERAKLLMLSDLGRDWKLADIAREAGASRFHLTRLFRRHAGAPLHRFLTLSRLAAALNRILDGEDNLTALALDLGFSSHSHFTAAFRGVYGATPTAARAMI